MSNLKRYKKDKKESFFQKFVNLVLTIFVAAIISSQVCTAANNNLRFVHVSDSHFSSFEKNTSYKMLEKSSELLDDVVFQICTSGPYNFVIFTGDLVNKPKTSELEKFIEHVSKLKCDWYAINGNHDISIDGDLTKKKFMETLCASNKSMNFDKNYYSFSPKKGYRVICLDSIIDGRLTSNGEINEEEINWLKSQLDKYQKDTIIIATHVPIKEPFSSPNHKMNNDYEVRKILKAYSTPIIVLQGHYHCTKVMQEDNILYISTPSLVTYPNAFRVINIHSGKNKVVVDTFFKETNFKDLQSRSKIRVFGSKSLYGEEADRNNTFEILKNKE